MTPSPPPPAPAAAEPVPEIARWVKENFEAVVVAFIMALLIRCFCLEVFKIPTASMEPTLLGDARERNRSGDRIMVNKLAYEFGGVSRYDVLVFKFPLDLSRNFIKRAVGLSDEDLLFRGGDIYTRKGRDAFALARKPVRVQENIWIPVYGGDLEPREFRERWKHATEEKDNWEVYDGALRTFVREGKSPDTRFEFNPADVVIYDFDRDRQGIRESPHPVPDLRLGASVEFLSARGEFDLSLKQAEKTPAEKVFHVVLRPGTPLRIEHPDAAGRPAVVELTDRLIQANTSYRVALLVYDGSVAVLLNGRVVHDAVYRTALPPQDEFAPATQLSFGTRGAEIVLREPSVARDVYYFVINPQADPLPADQPVHVPPDCFLLVGDNVRNSHDGRAWRRVEIEFLDGSTVYWDAGLFHVNTDGDYPDLPRDSAVFLKKGDVNPHVNEVGWVVPLARIRDIRSRPRPRHQFTLASGDVLFWDTDLVQALPGGGFALYDRDPATGKIGSKARALSSDQVADYRPAPGMTWVERRHVVGKAFAIWWPPGRWFRLIR